MDIKRQLRVALLVGLGSGLGSGLVGCKSPMGSGLAFWNKDEGSVSSSPDIGGQKYNLLSQEFGASAPTTGMGGKKPPEPGFLTSTWNKTTAAVSSAFTMKPKVETDDPTSLASKPGKMGAEPYVAAARILENQNKLPEAEEQYERALKSSPNDLTALVSLARLHDRQGHSQQAVEAYQRALKAHPRTALVHNDLGLCFARQQQWARATEYLNSAIALQPANPKYRNNLATVMVEMGRTDEALRQLSAVNPPAVAHYNLAYLLQQKGRDDQAIQHLRQAIATDATLGPAHDMLAQLTGQGASSGQAAAAGQGGIGAQSDPRLAAQQVSTPLYRAAPSQPQPAAQQSATQPPMQESVYGGRESYNVSDDPGSVQAAPGGASGAQTSWGSDDEATPAPVAGIEPLPPVE